MKKIWLAALAAVALVSVSCDKTDKPMTPEQQKDQLQKISDKLDKIVDERKLEDVKEVSDYYNSTLSNYSTTDIKFRAGNVTGLADALFASLPTSKRGVKTKSSDVEAVPSTNSIEWSFSSKNCEFRANVKTEKWEYVGKGNGDGIYLYFNDSEGRECYIRMQVKDEHVGLLKGERSAVVELYVDQEKLAECNAVCTSSGITDLKSVITAMYGPVKETTTLVSDHGEYSVDEVVYYDDRLVAQCTVTAGGVVHGTLSDVVSAFKHVTTKVNVLDELDILVNVEASIPDMFLTSWDKDYITKLQEYIDENVDVQVYFKHEDVAQAEIRLRVESTGAPLFGKVTVTPYIYFEADGSTCEFDAYFSSLSVLPDLLRQLEELLGNVRISY
ncbi:MAG: hypothetical protein HUJ93_05735 [Bacteroidales bacterium]|nr:hypothetical protein [Bacteroidales bacterium]MCF0168125.1 hypothetical protein [Bacteroidales bacterium]